MLISMVNALTLSPALCALLLRHGPPPGRAHPRDARRHRPCAARLRRHRRAARAAGPADRGLGRGCRGADLGVRPRRSFGLFARGGSGRLADRGAVARGRLAQPHRRGGGRCRAHRQGDARCGGGHLDRRLQHARRHRAVEQGDFFRDPGAVRRPHLEGAKRVGRARPPAGGLREIAGGDRGAVQPAADRRPRHRRRVRIPVAILCRRPRGRDGRGRARAGAGGKRKPGAQRRLHHLWRLRRR